MYLSHAIKSINFPSVAVTVTAFCLNHLFSWLPWGVLPISLPWRFSQDLKVLFVFQTSCFTRKTVFFVFYTFSFHIILPECSSLLNGFTKPLWQKSGSSVIFSRLLVFPTYVPQSPCFDSVSCRCDKTPTEATPARKSLLDHNPGYSPSLPGSQGGLKNLKKPVSQEQKQWNVLACHSSALSYSAQAQDMKWCWPSFRVGLSTWINPS